MRSDTSCGVFGYRLSVDPPEGERPFTRELFWERWDRWEPFELPAAILIAAAVAFIMWHDRRGYYENDGISSADRAAMLFWATVAGLVVAASGVVTYLRKRSRLALVATVVALIPVVISVLIVTHQFEHWFWPPFYNSD